VNRTHALTFRLLDALIREDVAALDVTASLIKSEDQTERVLCSVSALLSSALINVHGPIGALAVLDQSMADLTECSA
jgi:hypothetical protein